MAEYWEERRKLFVERTFLLPDPERLCAIDARPRGIGKIVAEALPIADLTAKVDLRIVD